MRYYQSREEAGKELAESLAEYGNQLCAVLALTEGGVVIGAEIAKQIHASLLLLATQTITLPQESMPIASMSTAGTFTYNSMIPTGELEGMVQEFHSVIDQQRLETFQKLNRIISKDGAINKNLLQRHTIIIVSDGFVNGLSLDVATDFLKPVAAKKIVVASPIASAQAVDRMHLLADQIVCPNVIEEPFPMDHYYEKNELPDHESMIEIMENISLNW